jgi:hypothetical protein
MGRVDGAPAQHPGATREVFGEKRDKHSHVANSEPGGVGNAP